MRRTTIAIFCALLLACFTSGPAFAQSPHFKHGSPQSSDGGLTLTSFGDLAGLGNGDLRLKLTASGNPTANCCNPSAGANSCKVPGQNPAAATVTSGTTLIPSSELKNGTTPYSVTTNAPTTPIPGAPQCPSSSWVENITDMAFTQAALRIQQSSAAGLADFTDIISACITYSSPTSNGTVSPGTFTVVVAFGVDPTLSGVGTCSAALFPSF
jgi:hypothetical protein